MTYLCISLYSIHPRLPYRCAVAVCDCVSVCLRSRMQMQRDRATHHKYKILLLLLQQFYGSLDFSGATRVSQYQKVHFTIFWIFWCKMKMTQADAPAFRMDCHPIQTNWCHHLYHPHHFTPDALPDTTLPIYPGLGQAPNMLACIPSGKYKILHSIMLAIG